MRPPDLRRAVEAARATASGLGLRVDDMRVVHDSDRVALRLLPCEVLARVAPAEQAADSAFEVEVARLLVGAGAPVGGLDPRAEPRVHVRNGFAVSLWTYYEPVGTEIAPDAYADVLTRHHTALRRISLDAPHVTDRVTTALREVTERAPELPSAEREFLIGTLHRLGAALDADRSRDQLLHGEPHSGNLLHTSQGPLLVDLGTCCHGPVEFDLAHAPEEVDAYCEGADRQLILRCRALNWALFSAWRWRADDRMPDRERLRVEGLERVRSALDRCEG
ncbi:aminoglycoside phosphotransferase family protein [Streptomyces sp. NPDC004539]|uniref:aminoglycoside phosphotransferase family protein n=1 Tax=Streptomyces sp. NPDC004539 TaxID=3154280 RepID=UPI0033BEE8C0